ncbi:hypothetical protein DFH07DRAFT_973991 [Mycena maculata]|uniref:Uncharacterized protein n=1 Tax=Mycena maculata TaxID=230809 RepID=A0AAD7MGD9_9AGAR|nr:hypothetical protein DFH07DRAFT_973991 [Mycena maculata]
MQDNPSSPSFSKILNSPPLGFSRRRHSNETKPTAAPIENPPPGLHILDILRYTSSLTAFALDFTGSSTATNQLILALTARPDDANVCAMPSSRPPPFPGVPQDVKDEGKGVVDGIVDAKIVEGRCSEAIQKYVPGNNEAAQAG